MPNMHYANCPYCGAKLTIQPSSTVCHCEYCHSDLLLKDFPVQPEIVTAEPTSIQLEKQPLPAPEKTMLPQSPANEQEILKWKKSFRDCALFYAGGYAFLFLDINLDSGAVDFIDFIAIALGFISLIMSLAIPPILAHKKPQEPDPEKNRVVKNIFLYYGFYLAIFMICVFLFGLFPSFFLG